MKPDLEFVTPYVAYMATIEIRHSAIDQEDLQLKIDVWRKIKPDDNFFFQPIEEGLAHL